MASDSQDNQEHSAVTGAKTPPSNFTVVKTYDPKGDLTLHRLSTATAFTCGRCNKEKKAKLVATNWKRWNDLLTTGRRKDALEERWGLEGPTVLNSQRLIMLMQSL
ncbi:hypothetical protein M7I_5629 [Glarea lozoyensis 74030]|uniref:Uncharacterized protein n=1 Tax=Glarea lozoyensis (strain ATCC 74030 / MF5533) TaxID=1104152 RepID=H0ESE8_GLAL7|nr:hypothetical protein M7I_5629 [Glarea lozoyensis 74030]